jgi:uncharacterized membrane protein YeaQ/YmgE (transglycosylase-associated protein family)
MPLVFGILALGILAGGVAWLIVRGGRLRTVNWAEAFIAGILGSFVGGLLGSLIFGDGLELRPSGIIGSVVGAIIVLVVWGWIRRSRAAG